MGNCLTSLVEFQLNRKELAKKYRIYRISLQSNGEKISYAKALTTIDNYAAPKALIRHDRKYWIMTSLSDSPLKASDDIGYEEVSFDNHDDLLIGRLLIRGLGTLGTEVFFSGLGDSYLFVDSETFKNEPVFKCVSFELCDSLRFNNLFLKIKGQTFSPAALFSYSPSKTNSTRYKIDLATGLLIRDPSGDLVAYSPGNGKYSTSAIDISGQQVSSLQKTRTGALCEFLYQFNSVYDGCAFMKLKELSGDEHRQYSKKDIDNAYHRLYTILDQAGGIQIVNASLSAEGYETLKKFSWPVMTEFVDEGNLVTGVPTIVVLDPEADYKALSKPDPKKRFYEKNSVTQSIYDSTVVENRNLKPLIESILKELAVKYEIAQGKFLAQNMDDNFWFVEVENKKGQEPKYHILKCKDGWFSYEEQDEYYFMDKGITLPEKKRFFETLSYVLDMSSEKPQVCTIVHEGIVAVPEAMQLFNILGMLEKGRRHGMEREYIEQEVSQPGNLEENLTEKLKRMLGLYPNKSHFFMQDFKEMRISYRSKSEKEFFNSYYEHNGTMLNYPLKSQKNEYLNALVGHFYNCEKSAFFSGIEKGSFKYRRGQFNHLRFMDGPDELKHRCFEMTQNYNVRNRQATILPFPFKYLAESKEMSRRCSII